MPLLLATQGLPMTPRTLTPDMSWTMFFNVFASLLLSSQAFYCQVASVVNIIIYWFQVALSPAAAFRHSSRQNVDGGTNLRKHTGVAFDDRSSLTFRVSCGAALTANHLKNTVYIALQKM